MISLPLALLLLGIGCVALHYRKSPFYIVKIAGRWFALNFIALAVKLHDPSPAVLRALLGPTELGINHTYASMEKLSDLLELLFPGHAVTILLFDNEPAITGSYPFGYQTAADAALDHLREKYQLSMLLNPSDNDFEQFVDISNWVHSQWQHGTSGAKEFNPGKFHAERILDRAQKGARFWCHVYSMTFIQVAASLGYQARLVSLSQDGYESSDMHAVAEVWSNFYGKWIVLDTDFNIWYLRDEIPLNVLEIHEAVISKEAENIEIVMGSKRPSPLFEARVPSLYKYYRYFSVDMRNDWLTNHYFPGHPARSDKATLFWLDKRLPPVLNLKTKVSNQNNLYWHLHRVCIMFSDSDRSRKAVSLYLDTVTPNFSHFEVLVNSEPVKKFSSSSFLWQLRHGENRLSVCSVDTAGRKGTESRLRLLISKN